MLLIQVCPVCPQVTCQHTSQAPECENQVWQEGEYGCFVPLVLPGCVFSVSQHPVPVATACSSVQDNFDEWGPVERIYNVASKTIAFVQYYWRASAEFAKEAMQVRQALHSYSHGIFTQPAFVVHADCC